MEICTGCHESTQQGRGWHGEAHRSFLEASGLKAQKMIRKWPNEGRQSRCEPCEPREKSSGRKGKEALTILACLAICAYVNQHGHRSFSKTKLRSKKATSTVPLRYATHLSLASEAMGKRGGGNLGEDTSLVWKSLPRLADILIRNHCHSPWERLTAKAQQWQGEILISERVLSCTVDNELEVKRNESQRVTRSLCRLKSWWTPPLEHSQKEEEEMALLNLQKLKEAWALNWIWRHEKEGGILDISQMFNYKSPHLK